MADERLAIFGLQPKIFIRPSNTDWRHNKLLELAAINYAKECSFSFVLNSNPFSVARSNLIVINSAIRRRIGLSGIEYRRRYFTDISAIQAARTSDVLYAYGCFPRGAVRPVVWHDGPTDTELLRRMGVPDTEISSELDVKSECSASAKLISVSSSAAAEAMVKQFPSSKGKIVVLPFILPSLTSLDEESISSKHDAEFVNIIFIGRQARKKGLDLLVAAFCSLGSEVLERARLDVVTSFQDGSIDIPKRDNITVYPAMEYSETQRMIRNSHILAMPSRVDSYGIVFVEALAAGTVPLAPNRPAQRSILDNGRLGELCDLSITDVRISLERLIKGRLFRREMALLGRSKFEKEFSVAAALKAYGKAFRTASI